MKGIIKWFSQEKGYGYILSESNENHYFTLQALAHDVIPHEGDQVEFSSYQGKKTLNAKDIKITPNTALDLYSHPRKRSKEPKVLCMGCNRKMVPLFVYEEHIFMRGTYLSHSVCPYCAMTYEKVGDGCFIASAVYQDRMAEPVIALRRFRDETLAPYFLGRGLIKLYYWISPSIARHLQHLPRLRACIKPVLDWLARHYQ